MLHPPALGFSPCLPVSVCGTGTYQAIVAFLGAHLACFATFFRSASRHPASAFLRLHRSSHSRLMLLIRVPTPSADTQYRNLHLLSIGYASRPRLRPRLTQGRQALPWNPQASGRKDSHLPLATHSGILPSQRSTVPCRVRLRRAGNAPLPLVSLQAPGFGGAFQPRTFSAQGLSASELLRTLLMYGCF